MYKLLLVPFFFADSSFSGAVIQPSSMTCSASGVVTTYGMNVDVTCDALVCIQLCICALYSISSVIESILSFPQVHTLM